MKTADVLRIGAQIARGLSAAHARRLVHRDVKPCNILLEAGTGDVKLTDFGVAQVVDDLATTQAGEISGTPQFMSPEQAEGRVVDHRGDLFSLGSVLYAMCCGRSPFRGDSPKASLYRVRESKPQPIHERNADIPYRLTQVINKLLRKNPDERIQTADEVASLLEQHLAVLQSPGKHVEPDDLADLADDDEPLKDSYTLSPNTVTEFSSRWRWWPFATMLVLLAVGPVVAELAGFSLFGQRSTETDVNATGDPRESSHSQNDPPEPKEDDPPRDQRAQRGE